MTTRFSRTHAAQLYVAQETRKDARAGDHAFQTMPRFVTVSNVSFDVPIAKYRNVNTDGYASKRESNRAKDLKFLAGAGEITELEEQPKFLLIPKQGSERAVFYIADFRYRNKAGELVVEDSKGMKTDVYIIKRKLMLLVHGITVTEV